MTKYPYPLTERQTRFVALAQSLAAKFNGRAAEHDRMGSFPFENYADIRASQLPALIVPTEYGGWGASLLETVLVAENLAVGDGSTALSTVMHFQTLGNVIESRSWPEALMEQICRAAVEQGALINSIATEPEMGSPSHGGKPATTATPVPPMDSRPAGYLLNGRKNFASMSPTLDYMIISASLQDDSDKVAQFVMPPGPGVEIVETWDALGMRSTGSHDVVLTDVFIPADQMIPPRSPESTGNPTGKKVNAWFSLCLSAVYMGVAEAALQCAARYAQERVPTALGKPIATLQSIQRRLGEAELSLHQARIQLYHTADLWDRFPDQRADLIESVLVAKYTATNNAIDVVDHAMRVVGGASMTKSLPLERYYRDVRGGVVHPMHDDLIFTTLGQMVLARHTLETLEP
jgi:alkylation response protein AidB-like acyl-CoA dehydrogenase